MGSGSGGLFMGYSMRLPIDEGFKASKLQRVATGKTSTLQATRQIAPLWWTVKYVGTQQKMGALARGRNDETKRKAGSLSCAEYAN